MAKSRNNNDLSHQLITFGRILKTGAQNFGRNLTLAIAAIAVMVITLTIILFSLIAGQTFNNTLSQLTAGIDISVYLQDEVAADDFQRNSLVGQITDLENVTEVTYISKEQALENFKESNKDNPDQLLAISQADNLLPASLRIQPMDPNRIDEIRQFLEQPEIAALQSDPTSYSGARKEAIDNIAQTTQFFQQASLIGIAVFAFVSILIIFNTIRMTIFNRRDELQIMRLLGANTGFIRGPFIVETMIYGIVAAIMSIGICIVLFSVAAPGFSASSFGLLDISFASEYFSDNFWLFLTAQTIIGIVIGAASSMIATRRYLKFKTSK